MWKLDDLSVADFKKYVNDLALAVMDQKFYEVKPTVKKKVAEMMTTFYETPMELMDILDDDQSFEEAIRIAESE